MSEPILIAGGGLGGLATALALAKKGHRSRVLEGAPEFGAIGYGIQLGPNVFPMFDRLGVSEAVLKKSIFPTACLMLDAFTGDEVTRVPTGASLRSRFGNPYIVIHRIDLHNAMLDACKAESAIELVPEAQVAGYEDHGDRVGVKTADGRVFSGPALVGADGLRSIVRAQMLGEPEPRLIGYVAHRTIVPMSELKADVPREAVVLWAGPGFHIVHYPLRDHTLFNIVAVFRTETYDKKGDLASYRAEIERTYRNAHPGMKALLSMMDLERRWAISDRDPIRHWSCGRVTLLGDAAHPTLQSLAQGACMAIEDGVCVAELIDLSGGEYETAFRQYESARYVRTARVTLESRFLWELYHADGVMRDVSWQMFSERSEQDVFKCLSWLYDGFELPGRRQQPVRREMGRTA